MTITEQLAEALRVLSDNFEHGWAKETRSETIEAVEKIARYALAAYEASKAEEERMDCYQYGKVPNHGQDIERLTRENKVLIRDLESYKGALRNSANVIAVLEDIIGKQPVISSSPGEPYIPPSPKNND